MDNMIVVTPCYKVIGTITGEDPKTGFILVDNKPTLIHKSELTLCLDQFGEFQRQSLPESFYQVEAAI